ncbi:competence/damage-inducible protein A [Salinibaculum rarum]|uniref:competence/damage-inducible protein A n=1 Tax=Salinibaculum rarum TaxID=3058903 RepID=UPI00265DFF02|nr:molybdopterin-binding protein [Salinibaculum sp. KK48]
MRVALVTVGDEILAGDTVNTNAAWLGRQLAERGVDVDRVTVVPDRVGEIARLVNEQRAEFDAVIVTGGVGPTHDDVTMDGVAAAFGRELEESEAALQWLAEEGGYVREELADGTAALPAGGEFIRNPNGVAPGCNIGNVYVLPGVPDEMKGMFEVIAEDFTGVDRFTATVEADEPESALIDRLIEVQEQFGVTVGSYPGETVRLKIQGEDEGAVADAKQWLAEQVEIPE